MSEPVLSGRYKILKKLSEGGFGQTFLAQDLHLPTKPHCVIKRLKPQSTDEESFRLASRLFEQEAEVLYRLGNHPAIPNLLAHFEEGGEFFLAQEYIEGATLAQEFETGKKFTEGGAVQFLRELFETLSFVHKQNVIHRDIKPSNLIRAASDGKIFLIDFGAVKLASVNPFNQHETFKSTVAIGTSGYAPSEQTVGKPKFSSDLYAAGLVAIQGLTGINPLELKNNNVTGEFMWQHKIQLHPDIANFISKLVRYDFRQRYNSAVEAAAALNMVVAKCGIGIRRNQSSSTFFNSALHNPPINQLQPANDSPQFIPPTIIQPHSQFQPSEATIAPGNRNFHPSNLVTLPPLSERTQDQFASADEPPKGFLGKIWNNDWAVGAIVVLSVLGLFFTGGYVLVRAVSSSGSQTVAENSSTTAALESPPNNIFQETGNLAAEAAEAEKRAKTKADWEQIGKTYRCIAALLEAVQPTSQYYNSARESITEFQKRAVAAESKAALTINGASDSNSSSSNLSMTNASDSNSLTADPNKPAQMPGARADKMYIAYSSSAGDYIGGGQNRVFTGRDGRFSASGTETHLTINFDGGPDTWHLDLSAPQGYRLVAGRYTGAQRHPFNSPTRSGLNFSGSGRGCNNLSGDFNVNKIIFDDENSRVLYLDATFTQYCENGGSNLKGRVHYDAR